VCFVLNRIVTNTGAFKDIFVCEAGTFRCGALNGTVDSRRCDPYHNHGHSSFRVTTPHPRSACTLFLRSTPSFFHVRPPNGSSAWFKALLIAITIAVVFPVLLHSWYLRSYVIIILLCTTQAQLYNYLQTLPSQLFTCCQDDNHDRYTFFHLFLSRVVSNP